MCPGPTPDLPRRSARPLPVAYQPDVDVKLLVLLGQVAPLRRHVAIPPPDLGIMSRLGLRLALLGPSAELFRVHHAEITRRTRPRLPGSSRRRSARRPRRR